MKMKKNEEHIGSEVRRKEHDAEEEEYFQKVGRAT
jgi:hypothetical protein